MLQEDLMKINFENSPEICYAQTKELFKKYPEQKDEIVAYLEKYVKKGMKEQGKRMKELALRVELCNNEEIIPLSYIARTYFKKSKSWLYQRINGNVVNGSPVTLSKEERIIFNNALKDISKRIGSINIA